MTNSFGPARMAEVQRTRAQRLLPGGKPHYVRCYDSGGRRLGRYTVVYTGPYRKKTRGKVWVLRMSSEPYAAGGFGLTTQEYPFDQPPNSDLGNRIDFDDMPPDCRDFSRSTYQKLWGLDIVHGTPFH